jgi:regulator of PEP synthase PpsR (kinase-PPPase family)
VIDISELSIEETAHRILRVVEERADESTAKAAR